ncbi:MAG: hypothetical protein EBW77_03735 [Burkholderiaceae bacterium]|nr:hypothetical protein [Burkholderiaceae bacterium]
MCSWIEYKESLWQTKEQLTKPPVKATRLQIDDLLESPVYMAKMHLKLLAFVHSTHQLRSIFVI